MKKLFRNCEYEVVNDNEIHIWVPYAESDVFDINVAYFEDENKWLHFELPQENNHLKVNIDNEDVIGLYISPIGIRIHYIIEQDNLIDYVDDIKSVTVDGKEYIPE